MRADTGISTICKPTDMFGKLLTRPSVTKMQSFLKLTSKSLYLTTESLCVNRLV